MRVSTPLTFIALAYVLAFACALPTSLRGRAYTQRVQSDFDARAPVFLLDGGRRGRATRFQARAFRGEVEVVRRTSGEPGGESRRENRVEPDLETRTGTDLLSHAYEQLPPVPSSITSSSASTSTSNPDPTPLALTPHAATPEHKKTKTKTRQGFGGHKKGVHHTLAAVE